MAKAVRDLQGLIIPSKADGTHVRVQREEDQDPRVFGRPKKSDGTIPEYTTRLPLLMDAMGKLPAETYTIIGEAVVYDEQGRTWFEGSQRRCSTQNPAKIEVYKTKYPIMLLAFDLIELEGKNLEGLGYLKRKETLFELLERVDTTRITPLPHVIENKRAYYDELVAKGEEGLILKRLGSKYQHTRSTDWLKIKQWDSERVKVVGYTQGTGSRESTFGSLVIAKLEDDGSLSYRGKVGTGFKAAEVRQIFKLLQEHRSNTKQVITKEPFTPVDIPLEVTVKFFEETKNGVLRFPSMLKDAAGRNMIHHESTIFGTPQPKQSSLSAMFAAMRKE